jgi:biotin carboxyl carrier protein
VLARETVLATLDDTELRLELGRAQAEQGAYLSQATAARAEGKFTHAKIAQAQADEVAARVRLLEYRIEKARIVSEISGTVVAGDLKKQIGAPVKEGDVLFEVAPLDMLRAELAVPDDQIADVHRAVAKAAEKNETVVGELATASYPGVRIPFEVERVSPAAEMVEQRNVFKVRVRLEWIDPAWMRPGMEGVAKISLGRRSYGWLLTRRVINWVRMKLWL